jgi:hypothetical protein
MKTEPAITDEDGRIDLHPHGEARQDLCLLLG